MRIVSAVAAVAAVAAVLAMASPVAGKTYDRNDPACQYLQMNRPNTTGWKPVFFRRRDLDHCADYWLKEVRRHGPTVTAVSCLTYRNAPKTACAKSWNGASDYTYTVRCNDWTEYNSDSQQYQAIKPFSWSERVADTFCTVSH